MYASGVASGARCGVMLENKSANCDASLWVLESSVRKIFVGMQGTAGTSLRNNGSLRAILH